MPLPKPAAAKRVRHQPAMPYAEFPRFVADLRAREGVAPLALEFLILTAGRTSEVIGATWDEIDFDRAVWTVPAERMKAGKEHEVPLSRPRNRTSQCAAAREGQQSPFHRRPAGKPLSDMAMPAPNAAHAPRLRPARFPGSSLEIGPAT